MQLRLGTDLIAFNYAHAPSQTFQSQWDFWKRCTDAHVRCFAPFLSHALSVCLTHTPSHLLVVIFFKSQAWFPNSSSVVVVLFFLLFLRAIRKRAHADMWMWTFCSAYGKNHFNLAVVEFVHPPKQSYNFLEFFEQCSHINDHHDNFFCTNSLQCWKAD